MKNLEFMELNAQELEDVNGGISWLGPILFQIAMELIDGNFFSDIKKGFNEVV